MSDVAWAAGLFEGEGTIICGDGVRPRVELMITDEDVIRKFHSVMGGTVSGPIVSKDVRFKPIYRWQAGKVGDTQLILRQFWPYLGERRKAKAAECFARYYESPIKRQKVKVSS